MLHAARDLRNINRRIRTHRRRRPRSLQELGVRSQQISGTAGNPLRISNNDDRPRAKHGRQRNHLLRKQRSQRLHALNTQTSRDLLEHVASARHRIREPARTLTHTLIHQHLAARRAFDPLQRRVLAQQRTLISDREIRDLLDLITKEIDTHRMLLSRREHVNNPATHRELTAVSDHVHTRIRGSRERSNHAIEIQLSATHQLNRLQRAQAIHNRLDQRTHRHHNNLERLIAHMQTPQHVQPAAHRVRLRGQPLMRQRLPRRELLNRTLRQITTQRIDQVPGRAARRRHHHSHRARSIARTASRLWQGLRDLRDQRRPQAIRCCDLPLVRSVRPTLSRNPDPLKSRVLRQRGEQTVQGHAAPSSSHWGLPQEINRIQPLTTATGTYY